MSDPKIFIVVGSETNLLWISPRGKRTWAAAGHAKNAWLTAQPWGKGPATFAEQSRYIVKEGKISWE